MQLERIEEMRLGRDDETQIAYLLERCFDTSFGGRSFYMQRHHLRLVLRDNGAIVGHMALLYRAVRQGARLIDIVGLAEVATDPDRRGEGIASRLLDAAIAEAKQSPAAFFLLFGDAPLYAANGFASAPNPLVFVDMTGAKTGPMVEDVHDGLMVLPLGTDQWDATATTDLMGTKF